MAPDGPEPVQLNLRIVQHWGITTSWGDYLTGDYAHCEKKMFFLCASKISPEVT